MSSDKPDSLHDAASLERKGYELAYIEAGGNPIAARLYGYMSAEIVSLLAHGNENEAVSAALHDPRNADWHVGLKWEHSTLAAATAYSGLMAGLATLAAALPVETMTIAVRHDKGGDNE